MALVVKKKVSLDFLGEDYKDAFLMFRTFPIKDYEEIDKQVKQLGDDNIKALKYIVEVLKKYFITGKFPNDSGELEEVKNEDLNEVDADIAMNCFKTLTGQDISDDEVPGDPKDDGQSKTPSSTAAPDPTNS